MNSRIRINLSCAWLSLTEEKINPNVMAVGDDDQGIMSFQGAEFSNMKDFADKFNVNKIISLTENYRSAEPIIEFAKTLLVEKNGRRTTRF